MGDPFTDVEQGPQVDEDQLKKVSGLLLRLIFSFNGDSGMNLGTQVDEGQLRKVSWLCSGHCLC